MALKRVEVYGKNFDINYDILNNDKKDIVVFLHGWGSNKEVMSSAFKDQLKNFKHIYIDMPGFGKSENNYILTTIDYANIMKVFLNSLSIDPNETIVIGHSFGGKIATTLMPKLLVLLSSAGIVEEKSLKVKFKIILAKVSNKIGLKDITKIFRSKDVEQMSEVMYATFKNVVNEDFSEYFKGFYNRTLIFWGKDDTATSLKSGEIIASYIKNSLFQVYEGDHYFFLQHSNEISDIINNNFNKEV